MVLASLAALPDMQTASTSSAVLLHLTQTIGAGEWIVQAGAMRVLAAFKRNTLMSSSSLVGGTGQVEAASEVASAAIAQTTGLDEAELKDFGNRVRQNCGRAMTNLSRTASGGAQGRMDILDMDGVGVLTKLLRGNTLFS